MGGVIIANAHYDARLDGREPSRRLNDFSSQGVRAKERVAINTDEDAVILLGCQNHGAILRLNSGNLHSISFRNCL
jgi:hypothetical protein